MSDTPRTDHYVAMRASLAYCVERDTADFARQLERELAEVTKQRDALVNAIRKHKEILAFTLGDCDEELYKALEELEQGGERELAAVRELAESNGKLAHDAAIDAMRYHDQLKITVDALTQLRDCDWVITLPDRMDAVREIAREALNKIKL